ncbi:DUF4193 family protein [Rhodococcus hoagii]|nr:DUF4193 family protein [Prescottella equi]
MATDYDAPRRSETTRSPRTRSKTEGTTKRGAVCGRRCGRVRHRGVVRTPGADLSGEELSVRVVPKQADEFTCASCFLVHHRSRLASEENGVMICMDCAGLTRSLRSRTRSEATPWAQSRGRWRPQFGWPPRADEPVRGRILRIVEDDQSGLLDPRPIGNECAGSS